MCARHRDAARRGYVFVDEWRLGADPTVVAATLRRVQEWPGWWPSLRGVESTGESARVSWHFTFRTRLPYRMAFDATLIQDDPVAGVRTEISGDVTGSGCWVVDPVGGGTLVRFDWRVEPQRRWMRLLAPLARPVFGWNHRQLMTEGGAALAARLGVHLLAPPISRLESP